jgi:hypothetical protein
MAPSGETQIILALVFELWLTPPAGLEPESGLWPPFPFPAGERPVPRTPITSRSASDDLRVLRGILYAAPASGVLWVLLAALIILALL